MKDQIKILDVKYRLNDLTFCPYYDVTVKIPITLEMLQEMTIYSNDVKKELYQVLGIEIINAIKAQIEIERISKELISD